jgi:hypothetical protein
MRFFHRDSTRILHSGVRTALRHGFLAARTHA